MSKRQRISTTTTITWKDTANDNAEWDTSWDTNEVAICAVSEFGLPYPNSSFKIESIEFFGTGTVPSAANAPLIEIMIASDTSFTDVLYVGKGFYSTGKHSTTVCVSCFVVGQPVVLSSSDSLYITLKCAGSSALTGTSGRITVSQE
jgi:hypothetical protein